MPQARRRRLWCCAAFIAAVSVLAHATANAGGSAASAKDAEQYLANGNLRAAEIELRNAVRESPQDPAIRARLAALYLRLGNLPAAEREALAARARGGNEADYLPTLADALLREHKFGNVTAAIQPGNRQPVLESKIRTALGTAAAALHEWDRAEELLRDAVRLDPSAAKPKSHLALLENERNPKEADRLIEAAIAANPRSVDALEVKAEMLQARGDQAGAGRVFDAILQLDPKNLGARLGRAGTNVAQENFKAADADLDLILRANPDDFTANYLRALELAKQLQYAAADRICERISSGFAEFPAGYYLQGATKFALGQFVQAEILLGDYLALIPDDPRAVRLMAKAAVQLHAAPRAIDYLRNLVDRSPPDASTLSALGDAYMADDKPQQALEQYEKAAALDPENPRIKTGVAVAQIDTGQGARGLARLAQVFAGSEAGATVAGPTLVLSELRAGHVDKAAAAADTLIKRDADNPLYQRLIGVVRVAQHDNAGAETAFRAALARDPQFSAAAHDLAQLYLATGRTGDAKKVYNDLLSRKKDDVTGLLGLADVAIAEKKWSEALDVLNHAGTALRDDPAPALKLITLYELRRDWNSAKAVTTELITRFPRNLNVVETLGRTQLEAGDTNGAISSYKLAHGLAPNSVPILYRYIALLNQAKYYRQARAALQDAVNRAPRDGSLKADLIRADAQTDGLAAALSEARQFAKDDPDNSVYDRVSAELYEKAGRAGDAATLLEKAIAARPSDDDLIIALSGAYSRMGDFAKAEAVLTRRLKEDPKNVAIGAALAPLYLTIGRPNEAKRVYGELLLQRPDDVATLIALSDIAIAEKKWPQATDYITRARAAAPNDPAPGLSLVNLYALRQDWKSATATIGELARNFPTNLDVLDTQARVQIGSGDAHGAIATLKRAHELAPGSQPALSRYLSALETAKDFREARKVLQAALDRDPQNASVKADMVRVEAEIGGLEAGLTWARDFAKSDPDNSLYAVVSAELYEKAGQTAQAATLLEKAIAAHPADSGPTIALSGLYRRTGDLAKAEAVLNARLKDEPKDHAVRSALASFYLEQGRNEAAATELTRLVAENPTDPVALNNLAWLYQQQGDLAKARELAERAFAAAPRAPQIDDTLGWILLAQGEAERALTYISAANVSAPHNPDAQYHLAVALHRVGRPADARAVLENLLGSGLSFADKPKAEKLLQELQRG